MLITVVVEVTNVFVVEFSNVVVVDIFNVVVVEVFIVVVLEVFNVVMEGFNVVGLIVFISLERRTQYVKLEKSCTSVLNTGAFLQDFPVT